MGKAKTIIIAKLIYHQVALNVGILNRYANPSPSIKLLKQASTPVPYTYVKRFIPITREYIRTSAKINQKFNSSLYSLLNTKPKFSFSVNSFFSCTNSLYFIVNPYAVRKTNRLTQILQKIAMLIVAFSVNGQKSTKLFPQRAGDRKL